MVKGIVVSLLKVLLVLFAVYGVVMLLSARNQFNNQQKLQKRLKQLHEQKVPLSGVQICQRMTDMAAFKLFNAVMPYHQFLSIPQEDNKLRRIGLGPCRPDSKFEFNWRSTQWRDHTDEDYIDTYTPSMCIPIEAWPEYEAMYGTWPQLSQDAIQKLNALTLTPQELEDMNKNPQDHLLHPLLSVIETPIGPRLFQCQTALLDVVHQAVKTSTSSGTE